MIDDLRTSNLFKIIIYDVKFLEYIQVSYLVIIQQL